MSMTRNRIGGGTFSGNEKEGLGGNREGWGALMVCVCGGQEEGEYMGKTAPKEKRQCTREFL